MQSEAKRFAAPTEAANALDALRREATRPDDLLRQPSQDAIGGLSPSVFGPTRKLTVTACAGVEIVAVAAEIATSGRSACIRSGCRGGRAKHDGLIHPTNATLFDLPPRRRPTLREAHNWLTAAPVENQKQADAVS